MANSFAINLLIGTLLCSLGLTLAREFPKECAKGPSRWCQKLKNAADCGAVGHCIATVWETQETEISKNDISEKFIRVLRELKDVKDLIDEGYIASRLYSTCQDISFNAARMICRDNIAHMEKYIQHVLLSKSSPETMCHIVNMCNNEKLDNIINLSKKKTVVPAKQKEILIGAEKCTWGPSYWCSNFSTVHECKTTRHCIERVWSKIKVPEDKGDICKICTDMVKQARDQLQSNETQEELKEVFEGSCRLIPIKIVWQECMKLADEFVPELVETLASEMNPQVVCSVAGLCNSERIDQLMKGFNEQKELRSSCKNCNTAVKVLKDKFDSTSYDDFLVGLIKGCGKLGSFSDSCSMLVFKYFENIYSTVKNDFDERRVCQLSGQCLYSFHSHEEYSFDEEEIDVQAVSIPENSDLPCELCEQLVKHLRDVLVANTTEIEFYTVLKGICKQTGKFKDECISLVEQYYPVIYNYLISDLKPSELCALGGVCPTQRDVYIAPLIPGELAIKVKTSTTKGATEPKIARVSMSTKQSNVRVMGTEGPVPPLPIERMIVTLPQGPKTCEFCQYFLHYVQVEISDSRTEDQIREAVDKACNHLPDSVGAQCKQFVDEYGQAVIALLVQEIDPASVCPALGMCPKVQEVKQVSINSDHSNCPLCLFAVEQLETVLKNNRTEKNIQAALENLCTHLSQKLRTECTDFVDVYSSQLIQMLIADMNAQEICVYLKLCKDELADPMKVTQSSINTYHENPRLMADRNNMKQPLLPKHMLDITVGGDIETNEIPDNTANGKPVQVTQKTVCVVCEFVMKEIDDQIKNQHNEDEIKHIVHNVCMRMPKSVTVECTKFVDKYADLIISLLAQELDPNEVCQELKLCDPTTIDITQGQVRDDILDCAVCHTVVMAVQKVLANDKVDRNIVHIVEKSCSLLPAKYNDRCHTMMDIYGDSVIHLIEELGAKGVCEKIGLCFERPGSYVQMYQRRGRN